MNIKEKPETFNIPDVVARIEHYSRRVHITSLDALHLCEVWGAFNGAGEQRRAIDQSPAHLAAAVYEDAVFLKLVVVLVRLLDQTRGGNILKSDRISFPVIYSLLSLPGVSEIFIARASNSIGTILEGLEPNQAVEMVRKCIESFGERLHRLNTEKSNRAAQMRSFRDVNFAHELRKNEAKASPLIRYIPEMLSEIMALMENVQKIVSGSPSNYWPHGEAGESAMQLWNAVETVFSNPG